MAKKDEPFDKAKCGKCGTEFKADGFVRGLMEPSFVRCANCSKKGEKRATSGGSLV